MHRPLPDDAADSDGCSLYISDRDRSSHNAPVWEADGGGIKSAAPFDGIGIFSAADGSSGRTWDDRSYF